MTFVVSSLTQSELNEIRIIPVSESHLALGLKPGLGRDYVWKKKYPILVRKMHGKNYVRYRDLVQYLDHLFSDEGDQHEQ